jgi:recombination protein RecR
MQLTSLQKEIGKCITCGNLVDKQKTTCSICENPSRKNNIICVVEEYLDMFSIEASNVFDGKYHIL